MTNVLLLGIVFNPREVAPARGQGFRDRVRCESLEQLGMRVHTLDDKHSDAVLPRHCQTNFANSRRMMGAIAARWGPDITFETIHLDYFFSPLGWAQTRWGDAFFRDSLIALATTLTPTGSIWLPYNRMVEEMILEHAEVLESVFVCDRVENPEESILFRATEQVETDLLRCPDAITNATQLPANAAREFAFFVLRKWT
jgi:hypothetical protein